LYCGKVRFRAGSNHKLRRADLTERSLLGINLAGELGIAGLLFVLPVAVEPIFKLPASRTRSLWQQEAEQLRLCSGTVLFVLGRGRCVLRPACSGTITNAVNLSAAPAEIHGHTCVLLSDGGNPSRSPTISTAPAVTAATSTRARCASGSIKCWGMKQLSQGGAGGPGELNAHCHTVPV